jgi:hypothetical protein
MQSNVKGDPMLVVDTSSSRAVTPGQLEAPRKRSRLFEAVFWIVGVIFAFVMPLGLVLAAIFVSSYGIPLPIEVRVP